MRRRRDAEPPNAVAERRSQSCAMLEQVLCTRAKMIDQTVVDQADFLCSDVNGVLFDGIVPQC